VRSALIPNVTALPTMLYIVRFGPYRPHGFVPGDASSLLSPTPQNAYSMLGRAVTFGIRAVLVLTCCMRFGASGSEVNSRHQEQNLEGGKVQSGQYTACWAGLLQESIVN